MRKIFTIIIFLSLSLFADKIERIELKTLNNDTIKITNYEGNFIFKDAKYYKKNILFFFFGTECPYCIKEIPEINKLELEQNELKIIGIHAQYKIADKNLKHFIKEKKILFEILSNSSVLKIVNHLKKRKMWIGGVPYYVFIDAHGNLEPMDFKEVLKKF